MACVLALTADLLFGSRIQGSLAAAGQDLELLASAPRLRERLADPAAPRPQLLIVDLTDAALDGAALIEGLAHDGELGATRTLAFYSHVDVAARERAERAGFDLIVPRSRMAREGAALVAGLL
jgi:DNA-binding NarL/FixJ family response regulator